MNWLLERLGLMRISDHNSQLREETLALEQQIDQMDSHIGWLNDIHDTVPGCNRCDSLRSDLKVQKAVNERLQREVIYWKNECNVARGK